MSYKTVTKEVVSALGGQTSTGKLVGTTQQAVGHWLKVGRIPSEYILTLESELVALGLGISRYDIRPDVYGVKPSNAA